LSARLTPELPRPQLNVRETFEFSARCQGVGLKAANIRALLKAEEEKGMYCGASCGLAAALL